MELGVRLDKVQFHHLKFWFRSKGHLEVSRDCDKITKLTQLTNKSLEILNSLHQMLELLKQIKVHC